MTDHSSPSKHRKALSGVDGGEIAVFENLLVLSMALASSAALIASFAAVARPRTEYSRRPAPPPSTSPERRQP